MPRQPLSAVRARTVSRALGRGAVTAETAMVVPVLVAITLGMVWLVSLAATQVRLVDAAREVARAVARDEPTEAARALGRRVAPEGASIEVVDHGETVTVTVAAEVEGPGGLFRFLPAVSVDADATAAQESP